MKHIVWVSGGKDSTALALRLKELNPKIDYIFACTPTGDELPEMVNHWAWLDKELGGLKFLHYPGGLKALIEEQKALPNFRMRFCTRLLKIKVAIEFMKSLGPCKSYVGLRSDEEERKGGIFGEDVEQIYPFREWGWGLLEVMEYLNNLGVKIPSRTDCARCPFQSLLEWWNLWALYPETYLDAQAQEEKYGHTFRSGTRDTWPTSLKDLAKAFESGLRPRGAGQMELFESQACRVCSL